MVQSKDITASIKLYFHIRGRQTEGNSASGLGRGVVMICRKVEQLGSLNRAAKDMGMAYSKAWRIVKNAETALGVPLFIRQGTSGSVLTQEAYALVDMFTHIEEDLSKRANTLLDRAFEGYVQQGLFLERDTQKLNIHATPELIAQVRAIDR